MMIVHWRFCCSIRLRKASHCTLAHLARILSTFRCCRLVQCYTLYVNPLKGRDVYWLQFAIQVQPIFLISDIWALWRSALSARVPKCQKLRMWVRPKWRWTLLNVTVLTPLHFKGLNKTVFCLCCRNWSNTSVFLLSKTAWKLSVLFIWQLSTYLEYHWEFGTWFMYWGRNCSKVLTKKALLGRIILCKLRYFSHLSRHSCLEKDRCDMIQIPICSLFCLHTQH